MGTLLQGLGEGCQVVELSLCVGGRAVLGVHDWDPHPWATQKVSVCALGSGGEGQGDSIP